MTEEPKKNGSISGGKNTAEISFGDKKYTINRLKAGKFYEALQVYMEMIKDIAPKTPVSEGGEVPVDFDKLIVSMFQSWPEKMVKFITVCCSTVENTEDLTVEKIKLDAYPEEITSAFKVCMELNKVAENLKNFVTPIGDLGAAVSKK